MVRAGEGRLGHGHRSLHRRAGQRGCPPCRSRPRCRRSAGAASCGCFAASPRRRRCGFSPRCRTGAAASSGGLEGRARHHGLDPRLAGLLALRARGGDALGAQLRLSRPVGRAVAARRGGLRQPAKREHAPRLHGDHDGRRAGRRRGDESREGARLSADAGHAGLHRRTGRLRRSGWCCSPPRRSSVGRAVDAVRLLRRRRHRGLHHRRPDVPARADRARSDGGQHPHARQARSFCSATSAGCSISGRAPPRAAGTRRAIRPPSHSRCSCSFSWRPGSSEEDARWASENARA